ncbi:MAG: DUF1858 domain-containing protein [archaeon]
MAKKLNKPAKITKDMTFYELFDVYPSAMEVLAENCLMCGGCPMAQLETIEQGAIAHGIDPDKLVEELNRKAVRQ